MYKNEIFMSISLSIFVKTGGKHEKLYHIDSLFYFIDYQFCNCNESNSFD
jgi:hypothetical protein